MKKEETSDASESADKTTSDASEKKETTKILVPIPEEFQKKVMELLSNCTEPECQFVREQCFQREDTLRKQNETKDEVTTDDYEAAMKD
jgi:hypothetical protein